MKAYTWRGGRIEEGIATKTDPILGRIVALGQEGRGRSVEKILVAGALLDQEGRVVDAAVQIHVSEAAEAVVLASPKAGDSRILVRVSAEWVYRRGTRGYVEPLHGGPVEGPKGKGAWGDAGRLGSWEDSLWILPRGSALRVVPTRAETVGVWVVFHTRDGELGAAKEGDYLKSPFFREVAEFDEKGVEIVEL